MADPRSERVATEPDVRSSLRMIWPSSWRMTRIAGRMPYILVMQRPITLLRGYWSEAAAALLAIAAALEVVVRRDAPNAPNADTLVAASAAALIVLPLLASRRWPFAAPASLWVLATALSFVDGRLVVFAQGVYAAGLVASFLLGKLPKAGQARIGLLFVLLGSASVVYNASGLPCKLRLPAGALCDALARRARPPAARRSRRGARSCAPLVSRAIGQRRRRPRSPTSAPGSRASFTMSSVTASA